jgi:hypothetical protein
LPSAGIQGGHQRRKQGGLKGMDLGWLRSDQLCKSILISA